MAEIEEKAFHHFLKFSPKVRMIVIDEMEPADRCRLTRCSKICNKEAKASKNYIYGLDIFYSPYRYMVQVIHGKNGTTNEGYILQFGGRSERKVRTYTNQRHETLWETELDSGTDVAQLALKEFKNIIRSYQRNIRQLKISISSTEGFIKKRGFIDFGIESLDSLEHLKITGDVDTQNILSKLRKPLKTLYIEQDETSDIKHHEAIYQAQDDLTWFEANIDNQQLLQFSAKRVVISIGKLTERNIFSFIRSWQDGTIGKDIESYFWFLDNANFNIHQFLKLLRISEHNDGRQSLEIKHFNDDGKHAELCFSERAIRFVVPQMRH